MEAMMHICRFYFGDNMHFENEFANESIYDIISTMALTMNDTLFNCVWKSKVESCSQFFSPVLTEDGLCFTFNALNSRDIYTDRYVLRFNSRISVMISNTP